MNRLLSISLFLCILVLSCGHNSTNGNWIVDHYYSKPDDPIPVQPLRLSACYFDTDRVLRKFILQDVTWATQEVGQLFYLNDRLHRIVVEDQNQSLLFEVQIEYDETGDLFKLNNPQERVAHGSNIISEPMVRDLIVQGIKASTEDAMDIFRLRVNADEYNLSTDRIPQHKLSQGDLDSLALFFGGREVMTDYDFRINTRDYQTNFYERVFRIRVEGVPEDDQIVVDKALIADQIKTAVASNNVLSSFNTYEVSIDDDKLIDAGGFGLVDMPDKKFFFSSKDIFGGK